MKRVCLKDVLQNVENYKNDRIDVYVNIFYKRIVDRIIDASMIGGMIIQYQTCEKVDYWHTLSKDDCKIVTDIVAKMFQDDGFIVQKEENYTMNTQLTISWEDAVIYRSDGEKYKEAEKEFANIVQL
jgi:hypothetical protein